MKRLPFSLISLILLCTFGCGSKNNKAVLQNENTTFLGDSVLTVILSNKPNGYSISILMNKDLCLWHFQRGDTIDRYLALLGLPRALEDSLRDSIGIVTRELPIATLDSLNGDFFFMDVNFDGEEDFVVTLPGYNRVYYTCFDLVNGSRHEPCIGFLLPMSEGPYCNLVGGMYMYGKTEFDFENKIIHVSEWTGAASHVEFWAKPILSEYETKSGIKIFKKMRKEYSADGCETTEYQLVNDTLREVSRKKEVYD